MKDVGQTKQVLLLFANSSVKLGLADADGLQQYLQSASDDKSLDMQISVAYARDLSYFVSNDGSSIYDHRNRRDLKEYDMVYFRKAGKVMQQMLACATYLRQHDIPYFDREIGMSNSRNKLSQMFLLHEQGLPIPTTFFCRNRKRAIRLITTKYADKLSFPLIAKATGGTRGDANYLVKSADEMAELFASERRHFLVQAFIPNDGDYRALVVYNLLRGLIKRVGEGDSHLNNTSKHGSAAWLPVKELNPLLTSYAIRAAQVCHRDIAGVDIIVNKHTGEPAILEVNRAPQIENASFPAEKAALVVAGFYDAINEPIKRPAKHARKQVIGTKEYVEIVEMPELGRLPAKIDTGAYSNSMHVADVKELIDERGNKTLQYTSDTRDPVVYHTQKYFKKRIVSSNGIAEERYIIELQFKLGDRELLGQVSLSNRGVMSHPILIGRRFLRQHGLIVDPAKRFTV